MKKYFNDTGACFPEEHYMVDISNKLSNIFQLVEQGKYFIIHRPRQYGKTTVINKLNKLLQANADYFPINLTFENIGEEGFQNVSIFIEELFILLRNEFATSGKEALVEFLDAGPIPNRFTKLDLWISQLVIKTGKKVVLMIDEVDKSSNNQLFLDFLSVLRSKYLKRHTPGNPTFHSVILAGLHDVKNLKLKLRREDDAQYNSPWNIAVDFDLDMSFNPEEISSMLKQYVEETGIELDIDATAQSLFYYTSGYPFLVSKVCKIIDEKILKEENRTKWNNDDIERAVNRLLHEKNTNFDSLIKKLENNKDLYDFIEKVILSDEKFEFNRHDPIIDLGIMHGIFKTMGSSIDIHNRIYRELIFNYMTSVFKRKNLLKPSVTNYSLEEGYLTPDGGLDFEKVLLKFQEFMKKEYSQRDQEFLERHGRLIFLAFLKPIINGKGYDFKEVQASEEKRMDVIVTYERKKFIIELKIWRGQKAHEMGIAQLTDYLETQGLSTGYLIIFDFTRKTGKAYKKKRLASKGKDIFAVWV
ncbi:MAG: AAA-like domain-containing protein [Candidatus Omnitrophota bacterium]